MTGRDSIFVMLIPCEANGRSRSYSAPTLSLIENMMEVLSRPVFPFGFREMTMNRVKLWGLSSIFFATI